MSTIKDVARSAEVSVATVSHVINKTRFVSPELSQRVVDAMDQLGYTPNGNARSLRLRKTHTIGLIVPDNTNPFFAELAHLVEEEGFRAGYVTVLGNTTERAERELAYLEVLISKRVDGIILAATRHDAEALGRVIRRSRIPLVIVDRDVALPAAAIVVCDNARGGEAAARELLALGHTRIACIGGPPDVPPAVERMRGFLDVLRAAGAEPSDANMVETAFRYEDGRAATRTLLERGDFTAVFAVNDVVAAGVLRELADRGARVPEDISVVGFDDAPIATMISPPLTTVRQPLAEMAQTAVSLLLARLGAESDSGGCERHVLPTELVVRQSTGPAAHGRPSPADRRSR
ncbi:MAG: LacI family transcriptional regulator [Actinobacteria bacterium]|nr:LacI family transcriptional regulator [Actinomycetota bacterium]